MIYVFAIFSIILAVLRDNRWFIGLTVMTLNNNKNFKKRSYGVSKVLEGFYLKVWTLWLSNRNSLSLVISIILSRCLAHASVDKERVIEACDLLYS